jgi:hypothetical protein
MILLLFLISTILVFNKPRSNIHFVMFYAFFWEVTFNPYGTENLFGINLGEIALAISSLIFIYVLLYERNVNKTSFFLILTFLSSLLISMALLILSPSEVPVPKFGQPLDLLHEGTGNISEPFFEFGNVLRIIRFLIFIPFLLIFAKGIRNIHKFTIYFERYFVFIIFICIFELTVKLLNLHYAYDILYRLITLDSQTHNLLMTRGGLPVIQAFTAEPGHLPYALLVPGIFLSQRNDLKGKFLFWSLLILLLICGSFRGFAFVIVLLTLAINIKFSFLIFIRTFILSVVIIAFIQDMEFFKDLVLRVSQTFQLLVGITELSVQNNIGSEAIRIFTWQYAITSLIDKPLFGIGLGSISVLSGFFSLFASIGLIGITLYLVILKNIFHTKLTSIFVLSVIFIMLFSWSINIIYSPAVFLIFYSYKLILMNKKSTL